MSEETRVIRLGRQVERDDATNGRTMVVQLVPEWLNLRALFNSHADDLAVALNAEKRPGVMVFVVGRQGIAGQLWLSATDELRSGSIGRHGCADLHLPGEGMLSLRHCLFFVRRLGDGVRVHVVDLSSRAGLHLESYEGVRAVDADGPLFLLVPGALIASFPTGAALPWDQESLKPFDTLAERRVTNVEQPPKPVWRRDASPSDASCITVRPGPLDLESSDLARGEPPVGELVLASSSGEERLGVSAAALDSGIILGRYSRCAGHRALGDNSISRVHALLLRRDRRVYLVDAGSTNGTWLGDEEVRCAQIKPRVTYGLGDHATMVWAPNA